MRAALRSTLLVGCLLLTTAIMASAQDHQGHTAPDGNSQDAPTPVPELTDEDRAAAFPNLEGHTVHDEMLQYFVLFDQFEWRTGEERASAGWDAKGWIGGDIHRLWFGSEGDAEAGHLEEAQAHVFYGRAFSRWWDFVAGVRQDFRPGPAQTWAAAGIQGLAPYFFELEATAYLGKDWRTQLRIEAEYDVLITNRLILQPLIETVIFGKSDPRRNIGSGLSTAEAGGRLRYEFRREFAPYVGITWKQKFGGTADFARASGRDVSDTALTAGLRVWF